MRFCSFVSTVRVLVMPLQARAQHAGDLELGYDDVNSPGLIEIEQIEITNEGILLFEADFEELDPNEPGNFSADEPGFNTNAGEGLLVNFNDEILLNVLDASQHSAVGVGYVNYYNPATMMLEALGRISILDNSSGTAHLVLNGSTIESGDNPQFIDRGDSVGDIHDHVVFDLLDDGTAPAGAYGLLLQLQSDFATVDGNPDLSSEPFWLVLNHQMDPTDFENFAIPAFGTAIPEPGSLAILGIGALATMLRRRRCRV